MNVRFMFRICFSLVPLVAEVVTATSPRRVCVCVCVCACACVRAYVCVCDYVYTCACISSSCVSFISSFFLFPSRVCTAIKSSYLHLSLCSSTLSGHPSSIHSKRTHTYLPTSCQRNQQHSRKHCGSLMIKLQTCAYFLRIPLVNKHCNGILSCNMSHVFSGLTLTTPLATQQIGHLLILWVGHLAKEPWHVWLIR